MDENKKSESQMETETQIKNNEDKLFNRRKVPFIVAGAVFGVTSIATAIALPIVLIGSSNTVYEPIKPWIPHEVIATNKILNQDNNKNSRVDTWNKYMGLILASSFPGSTSLDLIIRKESFINQFINFLTDNLYITADGTETGAITQVDASKMKAVLSEMANKESFANPSLATYTNLFNFTNNDLMLNFKNKTSGWTIEFTFSMPLVGLDLFYNDEPTAVSLKTPTTHSGTKENNIRLSVKTFNELNISTTTAKDYYFKPNSDIKLPSDIMTLFPDFFIAVILYEDTFRTYMKSNLTNIKTEINSDTTKIKSMSYWNSFAFLYDKANVAFLKSDLLKAIDVGSMYKFLTVNAKDSSNNPIPTSELEAIKTIATSTGTNATQGDQLGLTIPFINSPSFSNLLLNTTNTSGAKYTLELNVTKFSFVFGIRNLFDWVNGISIIPTLELSGKLIKTPTDSSAATTYTIANASYNAIDLISMSYDADFATGGLIGFFKQLSDLKNNETENLVRGLVALNSKTVDEQIAFWNGFSTIANNAGALVDSLKAPNTLANFITQHVDTTNLFGFFASGGSLPTIVPNILKTSIETARSSIAVTNLNFTTNGTSSITIAPTSGIVYGNDSTNDKFDSITIYFGYETNSLSKINVISKLTGGSNMSLSQTIGASTDLTDDAKILAAASKRMSIVFKKTTAGTTNTSTSITYLGQGKTTGLSPQQTTKPIVISEGILSATTQFIQAIKNVK